MTGFELYRYFSSARQIDGVNFAGLGEAIVVVVHQFIVRLSLPPSEASEEVPHVAVADKHGLRVVAAAVDPAAASVGPDIGAATAALSGGLIAAGHHDVPGRAAQGVG